MDNTPKTESIKNIMINIKSGDMVLPEFQRDFVWDLGKTYDLFDSLVKDIFIGSIIYGIPSFEITVRELDNRPRKGVGSQKKLKLESYSIEQIDSKVKTGSFKIILDGQQRITSVYRALSGTDEVWFTCKTNGDLSDTDYSSITLENLLHQVSGQESPNHLSIRLSDAYEIMEKSYLESDIKEKHFNKLSYISSRSSEEKEIVFRKYLRVVSKIQDLLKAEKLFSYYLLNTTSEKFALFFERSNSKGIQLDFIDILAAKLYVGFNLREKIEEFEDNNPAYELNREIIVRSIAYIVNEGKDIDRSSILSKLNYTHFIIHWDTVCLAYKHSLDFLYSNHFILNQSWMPYENMLIPIIMFYLKIGKDFSQMSEIQFNFIKYWYWASIFSQRYTSSSNEAIIQDSKILEGLSANKKINDKTYFQKLRSIITNSDDLFAFSKKGSVVYKGILNLINYKAAGLIDWKNSSNLNFNSKLDDHHIFPKEYLKTKFADLAPSLIDSVINRTLIPKITNIKIGKKAPSIYLKELKIFNPDLENSLTNHNIDFNLVNGVYDLEYESFIQARSKNIFNIISEVIIQQEAGIKANYFESLSKDTTEEIEVFATYKSQKVNAFFNPSTKKIKYNGQVFDSVSAAADQVKKDISGIVSSTNGWDFWKYTDSLSQEYFISELRNETID
jgi:hypothetical protein